MRQTIAAIALTLALSACGAAAEPDVSADAVVDGPVLAELFTSQGCSSCPPAEAFFEDLADRRDVAVIVWHVDVWDTLVHRGSSWKDPYSQEAFTTRLRWYNKALRGTPQIFTPQAIVGGETSVIGSRTGEIEAAIESAAPSLAEVSIADGEVSIRGSGKGDIIFVRLLREHTTAVTGGENKGRQLSGKNIALEGLMLGAWTGEDVNFQLPEISDEETCAVILQAPRAGRVLGAGLCG